MKRSFYLIIILILFLLPGSSVSAEIGKECVIVLHGMGRTSLSMNPIEHALLKEDYLVWNQSYPSRTASIAYLSNPAVKSGLDYCRKNHAGEIHFVTHSLGGILVRYYLQSNPIKNLGKIVMLGPPNQGSEIADRLKNHYLYRQITGPAGQEIGTDATSLPNRLRAIPGTIGIIAGNLSSDPWFSSFIPGDDDGKVSVTRARLKEMRDFLIVRHGHTFIMRNPFVIDQIVYFLKNGKFDPGIQEDDLFKDPYL